MYRTRHRIEKHRARRGIDELCPNHSRLDARPPRGRRKRARRAYRGEQRAHRTTRSAATMSAAPGAASSTSATLTDVLPALDGVGKAGAVLLCAWPHPRATLAQPRHDGGALRRSPVRAGIP